MGNFRGISSDFATFDKCSGERRVAVTSRQLEVLELAIGGLSRKEIARVLGVSVRTVEDRFERLRGRTGARNDAQLAAWLLMHRGNVDSSPSMDSCCASADVLVGCARLLHGEEILDRQVQLLGKIGCNKIFQIRASRVSDVQGEFQVFLNQLCPGSVLVVPSLEHFGNSLDEIVALAAGLCCRGLEFRSLSERFDTTSPNGRAVARVFTALAACAGSSIGDALI